MARRSYRHSYDYLRHLIQQSLEDCPGFGGCVEVDGKINRIADGLWHDNYRFWIQGRDLPVARTEQAYILRLLEQRFDWQEGPEPLDRLMREAETLQVLKRTDFAHPTPEFICFVKDDAFEPIGMIETAVPGVSLDDSKDRTTLTLISRVAATVHGMAIEQFPHLPSSADRTQYVNSRIDALDGALFTEFSLANEVREWIEAHLPSGDHNCLLHSDLLPQNLLYDWETSGRENALVGIIDWEMAHVGDPAYDLAIVSRGNRKVLGVKEGVKVLVDEYLKFGGKPISLTDVRVHELLLVLHWLEESWREYQKPEARGHGPDFYGNQLRSLFRRAAS
jgi:thiamine kinase-like enzyme